MDPSMKILESKDFIGSAPSIFLQSPFGTKKSIRSESILPEMSENDDSFSNLSKEKPKNEDQSQNNSEIIESAPFYEEEDDYESNNAKNFAFFENSSLNKETSRSYFFSNGSLSHKTAKTLQMDSKSRFSDETSHILQSFDKFNKISSVSENANKSLSKFNRRSSFKNKSNNNPYQNKSVSLKCRSCSSKLTGYNFIKKIEEKNDKQLFMFDFDKGKEFITFLPHNNIRNVLNEIKINEMLRSSKRNRSKIHIENSSKDFKVEKNVMKEIK